MNNLPTRHLIGTQKAGSTYMYNLLASHPLISLSNMTEVSFFSSHFDRGVEWYKGVFPEGDYVIDLSPARFKFGHVTAERMVEVYGDSMSRLTFVLILRNPIDYLYSHWRMHKMHGYFEKHPELYPHVPNDIVAFVERYPQYVERARYSSLLDEWCRYVDIGQFNIVVFEDFIEHTDAAMQDILQFWDIPYHKMHVSSASKNRALRFRFLHRVRRWVSRHRQIKKALKESRVFGFLLETVLTKESKGELAPKEREALKNMLMDDVLALKEKYEVDISWWKDFSRQNK